VEETLSLIENRYKTNESVNDSWKRKFLTLILLE